jgi:hypothetical protein
MPILAEAEDLPKTANIKTQLISLWTVPTLCLVLLIALVGGWNDPFKDGPESPDFSLSGVGL